ncbi:MAG: hypothetical protein M1587_11360 [Thaumarchaeota archaeon]|nr:hypothetical protein [Nitrososphaerota archaeon]
MEDERHSAIIIFILITISGIGYYVANNFYDSWAASTGTNWFLALLVYYFASQPLYLIFLYLMYDKFDFKGLIAAILLMISFDIMSLPHSVQSLSLGQTTLVPNDPNLAPYADWQLLHAMSAHGIVGFWQLMLVYIAIPTVLDFLALVLVNPEVYEELVENV